MKLAIWSQASTSISWKAFCQDIRVPKIDSIFDNVALVHKTANVLVTRAEVRHNIASSSCGYCTEISHMTETPRSECLQGLGIPCVQDAFGYVGYPPTTP